MFDRILIAGVASGCGKTTVTTALLSALKRRGLRVSAYKCGPDYIDPMFHREALGLPSHNLDPFFSTGDQLRATLAASGETLSVIEGVMGYYDGVGTEGAFSTYDVARKTETPVVLVVDCRGMYASAGAVLRGYREFCGDSNLRGVIFNNASPALYEGLAQIARNAGVVPLGFLPREPGLSVESRHLGLITAGEIENLQETLTKLAGLAEAHLDLAGLMALAKTAPPLPISAPVPLYGARTRIGVARDAAFCFLYRENLELLEALGGRPVYFSPLHDAALPEGLGGLYLPGGYPELYAAKLSKNRSMRASISRAILGGMPTIAECGGFLYLHETLDGEPMAGVIPASARKTDRLQRFGYVELTAKRDNLLCAAGKTVRAHSFHYYDSTDIGSDFTAEKPLSLRRWDCIHATDTLYAGFPHLYFPARPEMAERFIGKAVSYASI